MSDNKTFNTDDIIVARIPDGTNVPTMSLNNTLSEDFNEEETEYDVVNRISTASKSTRKLNVKIIKKEN